MTGKVVKSQERLAKGNFYLPSPQEIKAAQSGFEAWTAMQLAEWGVPWPPPRGWRRRLEQEHRESEKEIIWL